MPKLSNKQNVSGKIGVGNKQGFHEGLSSNPQPVAGPGSPGTTYNPGVPNPTVQPFLTAEDMMAYAMARQQYEEGLHSLDANYETSLITTGYEKENLEKGRVQGREESSDDMAARGLFRSSVRDADLFDIDATAEMRKVFLDTQLNTQKLNMETQKASMEANWKTYEEGVNQKKVENAAGVQANMPQWQVEPHWENIKQPSDPKQQKKQGGGAKQNTTITAPKEPKQNTSVPAGPSVSAPQKAKGTKAVNSAKNIMGKLYG